MRRIGSFIFAVLLILTPTQGRTDQPLLFDMSRVQHKPGEAATTGNTKVPAGTVELVDGRFGKACRFSFIEARSTQLFTAWVNPKENWDQYAGFSFWVKGDGSASCGGLEFIDGENYALRYGYCFPINSTEWVKMIVPWRDLIPELAGPLVDPKNGYPPSKFRNLWIGKWSFWREYPACSFTIERMVLEKTIERPAPVESPEAGLPRLLAKLKAKKPVTIVTMGDSLSDKRHWANRDKLWSEVLVKKLKDTYGSEVTLVNPAIGGTTLSQNVVLMPRWLQTTPAPDLVIVWFGGNDWNSGVRGKRFKDYLNTAVDHIRQATRGHAEILLLTTCPSFSAWQTMNELCRASFDVARERKTGFVDMAGAFLTAGTPEEALKRQYWAWDKIHLGSAGHDLTADKVAGVISSAGLGDLKTAPDALRMKSAAPGTAQSQPAPSALAPVADAEVKSDSVVLLSSFEPGGPAFVHGPGKAVKEHATDGHYSYRVDSDGKGYVGIQITDPAALRKFRNAVLVKIDIFNPQEKPVLCTARIDDAASKGYGSRYNDDGVVVPPGRSTFEINLTGLTKSNSRNFSERLKVDLGTLKLVSLTMRPAEIPLTLFFDNVRLEGSGLPRVEGLRAFDFGPPGAPLYPGFEPCSNQDGYTEQRGYGWIEPDLGAIAYMPDALTGDCASGREFRLRVPNGRYEVHLCWDMFGLFGTLPTFTWRKLSINNKEVFSETLNGAEFLSRYYYAHEDDEDLPGQDLWEKYIASYQKIHRFTAEVADGMLVIQPQSDNSRGRGLCFVVVFSEAVRDAGRKFVDTLSARRKARFNAEMVVTVPPPAGGKPAATEAERARGFIPFVVHSEEDVAVRARPPHIVAGQRLVLEATPGERQAAQIGLYPLVRLEGVKVAVEDLVTAAGTSGTARKIPAAAVEVRKVRNFLKRVGSTRMGNLLPYILQNFDSLTLQPGLTRALWITIAVPEDAVAGKYVGSIRIGSGDRTARIPFELVVHPFKLDKVSDITMSVTGSTAGAFTSGHPDLKERWWQIAELVMRNQVAHGMNAITGGPGAVLKGIRDGKVDIDYTAIDRWMALAIKYGLTMPGDSYQGLDVVGVPAYQTRDGVARCEAVARKQNALSYEELLRIVYQDVEQHGRAKGWPVRIYYFLDEPRPEYGNVETGAELIRIRTRACPGTLFSGYYSTGAGRDVYFETMPVSITHVNRPVQAGGVA
jgi:lysophospholipase L1-like esterase